MSNRSISEREQKKIDQLIRLENKGKIPDSAEEKWKVLNKRERRITLMLGANVVFIFIVWFGFQQGITSLSREWLLPIFGVFAVNIGLLYSQRSTLSKAKAHFDSK